MTIGQPDENPGSPLPRDDPDAILDSSPDKYGSRDSVLTVQKEKASFKISPRRNTRGLKIPKHILSPHSQLSRDLPPDFDDTKL